MNLIWTWNFKETEFTNSFKLTWKKKKKKKEIRTWSWPKGQASPSSLLAQQGPGLGRSNRPIPRCSLSLSPPLSPELRSGETLVASPLSGDSSRLWRAPPPPPWANCSSLRPLPPPPNRFDGRFLSEEICGWIPLGFSPLYRHRVRHLAGFSLAPAGLLRGGHGVCVHAGGSAECGAPGGAAVKSSPGSPWPATRALPRHAV
jgi:hypothetical protein